MIVFDSTNKGLAFWPVPFFDINGFNLLPNELVVAQLILYT